MGDSDGHRRISFVNALNRLRKLKPNKEQCGQATTSVLRNFTEFSERSSIHGVQYLGERKLHWSERIWWIISLTISVVVCSYFIHQVWLKLTPVEITFNEEATPVSQIPFPTITICNELRLSPCDFNYSHYIDKVVKSEEISIDIVQKLYSITKICGNEEKEVDEYISKKNIQIDRNIVPYLENVSTNSLMNCYFIIQGTQRRCKDHFRPILTDYGLCYTLNHLSTANIYKTELLADDFPKFPGYSYKHRMQNSGESFKLYISLPAIELSLGIICGYVSPERSVLLFIHSAEEMPSISKSFYPIPLNHRAFLKVRANIMSTDEGVIRNYNKHQRKCIAETENELKFFRNYTQSNCHLEFMVNETLKKCNCSETWMPRSNNTQICSRPEYVCKHLARRASYDLTRKCLPACNSTTYDSHIYLQQIPGDHDSDDRHTMDLSISFENNQYFGMKRSESYGEIDFLAGCGGIIGLFMGISFLSIVEILYFLTLRIFCNKRNGRLCKPQSIPSEHVMSLLEIQTQYMHLCTEIRRLEMQIESMHSEHEAGPLEMQTELIPSEHEIRSLETLS